MTKRYINVAYKDRDMAKRLGARWDPSVKRWYCPPGSALAKAYSWRKGSSSSARDSKPPLPDMVPPPAYLGASADRQLSLLG